MSSLRPIPFNFSVTSIALGEAVLCAVGNPQGNATAVVSTCIGWASDKQLGHRLGQNRAQNCYG